MKSTAITILALLTYLGSFAQSTKTPDALMLRFPDVSKDKITFVYAEDVWVVEKTGGIARRITSTPGIEVYPKFSPDGQQIAFSGNYDGNRDVYTLSVNGDNLKRLTYHPSGDNVVDWQADGNGLLISSRRNSPSNRFNRFFTLSKNGGIVAPVPLFYAEMGSYNTDGTKLAYQYLNRLFRTWKRYQGGTASDIWIYDFADSTSVKITDYPGTDALPMWHQNTIYFLSDRGPNHNLNLWAYQTDNKNFEQITNFDEYDVKFPSIGPNEIVFENGGELFLYSIANKKTTPVIIEVPSEQLMSRPEIKDLKPYIQSFWISPTGKRALFGARGELLTVPAEHGQTINLTHSSGIYETSPEWSPNGKSVAYFSDQNGEFNLFIRNADGTGTPEKMTEFTENYRTGTKWSPDSKKIAFTDQIGNLFVLDIASKAVSIAANSKVNEISDYSWSPDSDWLIYSKPGKTKNDVIYAYRLSNGENLQLTSGFYRDKYPVISNDSKYLFYVSSRNFAPEYSQYDATWIYTNADVIMASPLQKSTPSIVAPRNDVEKPDIKKEGKTEEEGNDKKDKKKKDSEAEDEKEETVAVSIEGEGFESRASKLNIPAGNYGQLVAIKGKLIFRSSGQKPIEPAIKYYDIESRKTETILAGSGNFEVSADGKKMLYSTDDGNFGIVDIAPDKKPGDGILDISGLSSTIDPVLEWKEIFYNAWRLERDYFYDPNMHGVDWEKIKLRYSKLLPYCTSRSDLTYIIGEMIGELNVGHSYVGGGDSPKAKSISVGMLGIDFILENNAFQISKIYRGASFDTDVRSPLSEPGLDINEGDYILAINHIPMDISKDPYASFQNLANKPVSLTINSKPTLEGAHEVLVKTIGNEAKLRNRAWIEENRQKVLAATDGRCGYIYVPNTGIAGQNELQRQFQGQYTLEALIIDERFNSGGQIPDRFIEMLNRPVLNYWALRHFNSWESPFVTNTGPKVMLANEWAGSGGDAFPYYFKKAKVGPVVGKRTWGGLVGISGLPPLIDNGFLSSPAFAFYTTDGKWDVEGYGVDPDYEVENTSSAVYQGKDAQLDKAIELINTGLKDYKKIPPIPPYKDMSGVRESR